MTFIIIPIYNESIIYELLQNEEFKKYKLILVDDGSNENLTLTKITIPFYFLRHPKNLGQGAALQTGMEFARLLQADIVVHFDADGQHNPSDIERLIQPIISKKADVVIGSRFLQKQNSNDPISLKIPVRKKIILRCARIVQFIYTGVILSDSQMGLRAISGSALQSIEITENRMAHAIELIKIFKGKKFLIKEVPVIINYTKYANKKGQKLLNGFFIVIRLFINKLTSNIQLSSIFISILIGMIIWGFNKKESLLFTIASIFIIYLFNLAWMFIIRRSKLKLINKTQIIRREAIQRAKEFESQLNPL